MRPKVYIETTIPSFYYEDRRDAASVARRNWSRQWWALAKDRFELLTSVAVLEELGNGHYPKQQKCIRLLDEVPLVVIEPEIIEVVQVYISHKVMPSDPAGDALHLAVASHHKCDFLLTWNCRHLANANKFGHIRRINTLLGLFVPNIVTPLELLGDEDYED
jgi:predicted nucleic acid-binding protein